MAPTILVLPGYGDSGPEHWQTLWERRYGYTRVVQDDWERPDLATWVGHLEEAVARTTGPVLLVAHSLGCALVAHWATGAVASPHAARVRGALLVAPPDVDEIRHLLPEVESFAPMPVERLPFPAVVVMSETDAYAEPVRARGFAQAWGARLVELGDAGHINAESNLGEWPEGHRLLAELAEAVYG
jgi:predicted alpha/beta hydrolase family esterase